MLKITSIRLKKLNKQNSKVIGVASVEFEGDLVVHGIKLVDNDGDRFLSFPNKKLSRYEYNENNECKVVNEYSDVVHPSNHAFREYVEKELFKIYDKKVEEVNE